MPGCAQLYAVQCLAVRVELQGLESGPSSSTAGRSAAAPGPAGASVAPAATAEDYADEPTLPEDLEDIPDLRPGQRGAATVPAYAAG